MIIRIFATLFVLFAISRVLLRHRDGSIGLLGTAVWTALWFGVLIVFWWPNLSQDVAQLVGVGRGADLLVYLAVIALLYGMFRLYVKVEFIEHEITSLTRNLAIPKSSSPSDTTNEQPPTNA